MRMRPLLLLLLLAGTAFISAACSSSNPPGDPVEPAFEAQRFSARSSQITNTYFPWVVHTTRLYLIRAGDEVETVIVEVLPTTRMVNGVECAVVRDSVYRDDLLIEDTHDWFAQDDEGHVWYMGEEVNNYEYDDEGNLISTDHDGAWEAGADGAEPGFLMKANPQPGDTYRQEYYAGEAEDMAEIVATGVGVTLADGTTYACLKTREWTPLEPGFEEFKYYAPGVGVVVVETTNGTERGELLGTLDTSLNSLPDFDGATFTNPAAITNNLLPFTPGMVHQYEVETEDGVEETTLEVLVPTRMVAGIECRVVRDRVYLEGLLIEDTHDWYAQDDAGNVWYMGEEVDNYEYDDDDNLLEIHHEGAWETGVDGAEPGIVMWSSPTVGHSYRQEYLEGEAEDMGLVVALGVTVHLADGSTYTDCVQTLDWVPLDPSAVEYKFYAPGVGVVAEEKASGEERLELVDNP